MGEREPKRILKIGAWELWGVPRSEDDPIVQQRRELASAVDDLKQAVFDEIEPAVSWLNDNIWAAWLFFGAWLLMLVGAILHKEGLLP